MVCAVSGAAYAQSSTDLLNQARAALAAGKIGEAERLLLLTGDDVGDRNDLDFLRGTVAVARGHYDTAIAAFRAILERDPSLHRVRLDLARTLFLKGDDAAAEHHFRTAAAAGLPATVQSKVEQFLHQIKRRKRWAVDFSVGIAPDTNINAATASDTVDIFGLPFYLDPEAKEKSGVGFTGMLSGSYHIDLGSDKRLVMGARLDEAIYGDRRFNDRTLSAHAGPRFLLGNRAEVTLKAVGSRRWYGGRPYSRGVGGQIEGQVMLSPRLLVSAAVNVLHIAYDAADQLNGPLAGASIGATYGLNSVTFVRLEAAVVREQTADEPFRNMRYSIGGHYYRILPWGFGLNLGASVGIAQYDAALVAFGATRRDTVASYRVGLSNRHLDLFGFMPQISYTHTNRRSNIALYQYARDRVDIGVVRNF